MRFVAQAIAVALGGLLLGSCGDMDVEPQGTPLTRGMWTVKTHFSTPSVDGLSVDSLRSKFPKDSETSECMQPSLAAGRALLRRMSLSGGCALDSSKVENGTVTGAGTCDSIINTRKAKAANVTTDNWLKIKGTYTPDYISIDGDIAVTIEEETGAISRVTASVTHTAERTGDCS